MALGVLSPATGRASAPTLQTVTATSGAARRASVHRGATRARDLAHRSPSFLEHAGHCFHDVTASHASATRICTHAGARYAKL